MMSGVAAVGMLLTITEFRYVERNKKYDEEKSDNKRAKNGTDRKNRKDGKNVSGEAHTYTFAETQHTQHVS